MFLSFPTFPLFSRPSLRNGAIVLCCSALTFACGCVSQSEHARVTTERDQFAAELSQAKSAGDVSRKHGEALALDLEVGRGQLEASEKAREELSGRLSAADKRAAALTEALQAEKAELAELGRQRDKEAAGAQARLADAQTALTAARNDLAVAKHDLASAERARQETADERDGLTHKSEQLAADLDAAKSRSADLEKKLTAAEAGLAGARSALAASRADAAKGQSDLDQTRQQVSRAEQATTEARKSGDEARQAAESLRKDLTESHRQAAEFKATLDGDAAELTRLRAQAETAKDAGKQADVKEPTE